MSANYKTPCIVSNIRKTVNDGLEIKRVRPFKIRLILQISKNKPLQSSFRNFFLYEEFLVLIVVTTGGTGNSFVQGMCSVTTHAIIRTFSIRCLNYISHAGIYIVLPHIILYYRLTTHNNIYTATYIRPLEQR